MPALSSQQTHTHTHTNKQAHRHAHTHSLSHSPLSVSLPAEVFVCKGNGIWWWKYPWSRDTRIHIPKHTHTYTNTRLLNFTDMAIWQKMCFFLGVAAGISGCTLGEMSDGRIEMLLKEGDAAAARRDTETEWNSTMRKTEVEGEINRAVQLQKNNNKGKEGGEEECGKVYIKEESLWK